MLDGRLAAGRRRRGEREGGDRKEDALHGVTRAHCFFVVSVVVVSVVLLEELGIEELLDDDGVLLDDEDDGELALLSEALPLIELEELGVMELLLDELGVAGVVVSVALELEDGVALVVAGVVVVVVVLVPVLLRSQPVTAAVATASTATRGMSLFMTSPFECGLVGVRRFPLGARDGSGSTKEYTHNACHRVRLWDLRTEGRFLSAAGERLPHTRGNAFRGASDGHRQGLMRGLT